MCKNEVMELIKRRRFQLLIHSFIYYRLNETVVSNETFDQWSDELNYLQKKYPDISKEVELYDLFKDYVSSSDSAALAFDSIPGLYSRAKYILQISKDRISE